MKDNKAKHDELSNRARFVIIALAVFIIFESVMIVDGLTKAQKGEKAGFSPNGSSKATPAATKSVQKITQGEIYFEGPAEMKKNMANEVNVFFKPTGNLNLDGIDLVLSYDPPSITIAKATAARGVFDTIARELIQPEKNRLIVSLLELEKEAGVEIKGGEAILLVTLSVKPLLASGEKVSLNVSEDLNGKTKILEAGSGKEITFSTQKYNFSVID